MTKEQFLKTYGQPNTVVSFKNDEEKMEFLKECKKYFNISYQLELNIMKHIQYCISLNSGSHVSYSDWKWYESDGRQLVEYCTPSPKSLIKDGWMGVQNDKAIIYFLPSLDLFIYAKTRQTTSIEEYNDDMTWKREDFGDYKLLEIYDNLGILQWKREEKSAKDIEIERIESEIKTTLDKLLDVVAEHNRLVKIIDDLIKLKGE